MNPHRVKTWPHVLLFSALLGALAAGQANARTSVRPLPGMFSAPPYQIVTYFTGANGFAPYGPLLRARDGSLWGTAQIGGANNLGCIFRIVEQGGNVVEQVVYSFTAGVDAAVPWYGLAQAPDGTIYGQTESATLFSISPTTFQLTTRFVFPANVFPAGGLLSVGTQIYGTTGSSQTQTPLTLFRFDTTTNTFTTIHTFTTSVPVGTPILGRDGRLYGAQLGSVYAINPDGSGFTTLIDLIGNNLRTFDGVIESHGRLFGTTIGPGDETGGTVFSVALNGTNFQTVHSFTFAQGSFPVSTVTAQGAYLYGVTGTGGPFGQGVFYRVGINGAGYTIVHAFAGGSLDGSGPSFAPTEGIDGRYYGIAGGGPPSNGGVVYAVDANLGSPIQRPAFPLRR